MTKKNEEKQDNTKPFNFVEACNEIKGHFTRKGFIKFVGEDVPKTKSEFDKVLKKYLKMNVEAK